MAYQTSFMPRPQGVSNGRPATPVVPIDRVRPQPRFVDVPKALKVELPPKRDVVDVASTAQAKPPRPEIPPHIHAIIDAAAAQAGIDAETVLTGFSGAAYTARQIVLAIVQLGEHAPKIDIPRMFGVTPGATRFAAMRLQRYVERHCLPIGTNPVACVKPLWLELDGQPEIEASVTADACLKAVSEASGIAIREIMSDRRQSEVVRPRQVAMWLLKKFSHRSLPEIGRLMGGRDHTTILHAVRKIEKVAKHLEPVPRSDWGLGEWSERLLKARWP